MSSKASWTIYNLLCLGFDLCNDTGPTSSTVQGVLIPFSSNTEVIPIFLLLVLAFFNRLFVSNFDFNFHTLGSSSFISASIVLAWAVNVQQTLVWWKLKLLSWFLIHKGWAQNREYPLWVGRGIGPLTTAPVDFTVLQSFSWFIHQVVVVWFKFYSDFWLMNLFLISFKQMLSVRLPFQSLRLKFQEVQSHNGKTPWWMLRDLMSGSQYGHIPEHFCKRHIGKNFLAAEMVSIPMICPCGGWNLPSRRPCILRVLPPPLSWRFQKTDLSFLEGMFETCLAAISNDRLSESTGWKERLSG